MGGEISGDTAGRWGPGRMSRRARDGVASCIQLEGMALGCLLCSGVARFGPPWRRVRRAGRGAGGAEAEIPLGNRAVLDHVPAVPKAATAVAPAEDVPFEQALQKLESVVEAMESGELSLEQLLQRYEEGARLARLCQHQLAAAELKIGQLEESLSGDLSVRPVADDSPVE